MKENYVDYSEGKGVTMSNICYNFITTHLKCRRVSNGTEELAGLVWFVPKSHI